MTKTEYRDAYGYWHREDGPAIEYEDGYKAWCIHGKYHRTDGPAVEFPNGTSFWWVNGKQATKEQFNNKLYRVLYIK